MVNAINPKSDMQESEKQELERQQKLCNSLKDRKLRGGVK